MKKFFQKAWFQTKYFFKSSAGKTTAVVVTILILLSMLIIPMIISLTTGIKDQISPYKRDSHSGTQEAFNELMLDNKDNAVSEYYSIYAAEVSSNDKMVSTIEKVDNSIGYVSYGGAVNELDSNNDGILSQEEQDASPYYILDFYIDSTDNDIDDGTWYSPTDSAYPARNFNMFWRGDSTVFDNVPNNDITDIKLTYNVSTQTWEWTNLSIMATLPKDTNTLVEATAWGVYNFILYGESAWAIIEDHNYDNPEQNTGDINNTKDYNIVVDSNGAPDSVFTQYMTQVVTVFGTGTFDLYTIGSTSVGATDGGLLSDIIEYFRVEIANPLGVDYRHQDDHSGSGSAFNGTASSKGSGSDQAWMGFQSKTAKLSDVQKYYEDDTLTNTEFSVVYNPFVKDQIALIANKDGMSADPDCAGISQTMLQNLYLTNNAYSWAMIYEEDADLYSVKTGCEL